MNDKFIKDHTILLGLVGSHAYGTATEYSDKDYMGVYMPSLSSLLSGVDLINTKDQGWQDSQLLLELLKETKIPKDNPVIYSFNKYVDLLSKGNPSVLATLFLDSYITLHPVAEQLLVNRNEFLCTSSLRHFVGYAQSQIQRMNNHRKWLLDPPRIKPMFKDYIPWKKRELSLKEKVIVWLSKYIKPLKGTVPLEEPILAVDFDRPFLTDSELNAFCEFLYIIVRDKIEFAEPAEEIRQLLLEKIDLKALFKTYPIPEEAKTVVKDLTLAKEDFLTLVNATHTYKAALKKWQNYRDWLKNRNSERFEIENRIGYDGKHAAHCLRTLNNVIEICETGQFTVDRRKTGDAEYLLDIRNGKVSYSELLTVTERAFDTAKELLIKNPRQLRTTVNKDFLKAIQYQVVIGYWKSLSRSGIAVNTL